MKAPFKRKGLFVFCRHKDTKALRSTKINTFVFVYLPVFVSLWLTQKGSPNFALICTRSKNHWGSIS